MDIQLTHGDRVAVVTINRPHDENRLTRDALDRLHEITQTLCSDQETLAVIITGAGDQFFSAGMLHPKVRATLSKGEILDMVRAANAAYDQIETLPQIVIAALNGITRAGAAEMTLACDIRLAADHATFAIPEAKWGGVPGAGAPVRLPGILGAARALELICTGRELTAPEMERYGLVQRVVPRQELMSVSHALAGGIATCGPLAIRGAKRIVRLSQRAGFTAARELSDALRSALESTSDMAEGQAAILEGRTPRFTGR